MSASDMECRTVVVGAGVSGLAAALLLAQAGDSVRVVEARAHPGGRIRSVFDAEGSFLGDLGPTWIWPASQPVARRWVEDLGLETFPQFRAGRTIFDHGPALFAPELLAIPSPPDEARVVGGSQAIVDQLVAGVSAGRVLTGSPVTSISFGPRGVEVTRRGGPALICERVVVAAPPRVAVNTIAWEPALPAPLVRAMSETPTWMAPHAKVVVVYDEPFWRARGLSGRIASRSGPIAEAHDHCGPEGSPAALFGFLSWPAQARAQARGQLEQLVAAQLERCFGAGSPEPLSIHLEDWATDPWVASPEDLTGAMEHPDVRPGILREPHAEGRLWFAGAETALTSPGLIEGAFDAARRVANALTG